MEALLVLCQLDADAVRPFDKGYLAAALGRCLLDLPNFTPGPVIGGQVKKALRVNPT
jgi:hypothetical protein